MTWLPNPDLQARLQDAVTRLPGSAHTVAAELSRRGIRALQFCGDGCALAVYFQQEIGGDVIVGVGNTTVNVHNPRDGYMFATATLPDAAVDFVRNFDMGAYPGLVEHGYLAEATA